MISGATTTLELAANISGERILVFWVQLVWIVGQKQDRTRWRFGEFGNSGVKPEQSVAGGM